MAEFTSEQQHYDWSLRSVKAVLLAAGDLMRRQPDLEEEVVVMTTLRDMNESKLVVEDKQIFHTMISSLFPSIEAPEVCNLIFVFFCHQKHVSMQLTCQIGHSVSC